MELLPKKYIEKAESIAEHLESLYRQSEETTEPKSYFRYTEMNQTRVRRLLKRNRWTESDWVGLNKLPFPIHLLALTEHWCGDAANSIPFLIQMVDHVPMLDMKMIYRDQHPELMDAFLTDGARSIPKVIAYDPESRKVLGSWGPRPQSLQIKIKEWKRDPEMDSETRAYWTQKWYIEDKGQKVKKELIDFINQSVFVIDPIHSVGKIIGK